MPNNAKRLAVVCCLKIILLNPWSIYYLRAGGYKWKPLIGRNSPKLISWWQNSKGQSQFVLFLSLLGSIWSSSILLVICINFSGYKRGILGKSASMRSCSLVCDGWKAPLPWFAVCTCHRSWNNFVIPLPIREKTEGVI